jgi:hypothetical protein
VPDIPPPGGVGIGRGAEYVVDVDGGVGGADGVGDAGRGGTGEADCGRGGMVVAGAAGRGGAAGRAGGGVAGRGGGGAVGRGGGVAGRATGVAGRAAVGCAGTAGLAAGLRAAFLAVLRAAVFFFAAALRAAVLRPVARAAVLRLAALRAPARFFAVDFVFFLLPSAAPARRMAEVAARFIFFKAAAVPELLFRLLDLAMIGPPSLPRLALWTKRAHNKTHPSSDGKFYTAISRAFCIGTATRMPRNASGCGPPVAQSMSSTR